MVLYNMTLFENATPFYGSTVAINTLSETSLVTGLYFVFGLLLLLGFYKEYKNPEEGLAGASLIMILIGFPMAWIGILPYWPNFIFFAVLAGSLFSSYN